MKQLDLVIQNPTGLHARPAKTFVKLAKKFSSKIQLKHNAKKANGKSLIGVLKLGVKHDGLLSIRIKGEDEDEAAIALKEAIESGLGEDISAKAPIAPVSANGASSNGTVVAPAQTSSSADLNGIGASIGVAIGRSWQLVEVDYTLPTGFDGADAEWAALTAARQQAEQQLGELAEQTAARADEEAAEIFIAHRELLDDPDLLEAAKEHIDGGRNAAVAWTQATEESAVALSQLSDPLLAARSADMRDVGKRVVGIMLGHDAAAMPDEPFILLATDLSPSVTATLDKQRVLGICTAAGGPNAHAAILARALGLPAVVAIGPELLKLENDTILIADGQTGGITISPNEAQVADAKARQQAVIEARRLAKERAAEHAVTQDGVRIEVVANVGGVADAEQAFQNGAEGVGLLRTEFLFLEREQPPSLSEQAAVYGDILAALQNQPVIIRTLDVGGDKQIPYIEMAEEENPFLGVRGIRLCLERPELFREQLDAIAQASSRGIARVMFPMVSSLEELQQARVMLDEALAAAGAKPVEVGIMIEVPSAAVMADIFAPYVDFFSIGTNDLTQYTMAIDRMHPTLSKLADGLHPSVLRLIKMTADAAHAHGKWVGICGELGADPQAVPILVGLGVDELSVNVPAVPTVKAQIRTLTKADAEKLAAAALASATATQVRQLVA